MQKFLSAVLYTALAFGANAQTPDATALAPLLTGPMQGLVLTDERMAIPPAALIDAEDQPADLSDYRGRYVLLNFWATWCAPCRAELGSLDRLQAAEGDGRFAVVTIATGPNPLPAIRKLFEDERITRLPILRDPRQDFAHALGVLALPVTVLVDPEGREIARLVGDAEWDSPEARALVAALKAGG